MQISTNRWTTMLFCVRIQCDSCKNCGSNSASYFIPVILKKDSPRIYPSTYLRSSFFPLIQQFWHSVLSGQRWYKNSWIYPDPRASGSKTLSDKIRFRFNKKKKKQFSLNRIIINKKRKKINVGSNRNSGLTEIGSQMLRYIFLCHYLE